MGFAGKHPQIIPYGEILPTNSKTIPRLSSIHGTRQLLAGSPRALADDGGRSGAIRGTNLEVLNSHWDHRKPIGKPLGKWCFHGILWDLPFGKLTKLR